MAPQCFTLALWERGPSHNCPILSTQGGHNSSLCRFTNGLCASELTFPQCPRASDASHLLVSSSLLSAFFTEGPSALLVQLSFQILSEGQREAGVSC